MHNIQKLKNDFITSALMSSLLFCSMPNQVNSLPPTPSSVFFPSSGDFDAIICNLLNHAHGGDMEGVDLQFKNIAEMLEQSDDALRDSYQFLDELVNKLNSQYGTSLTVSELLQITRESIRRFPLTENNIEKYQFGLDLIELHQASLNKLDPGGFVAIKHHKNKSNVWTWLSVATISVAAVTLCILLPESAPAVISGAVEVGKAALGK